MLCVQTQNLWLFHRLPHNQKALTHPHGWGIGGFFGESDCAWRLSQVRNIRKVLREIDKPFGLYPNFLSPVSGNWVQRKYWPLGFHSHGFPFGLPESRQAPAPGFTHIPYSPWICQHLGT